MFDRKRSKAVVVSLTVAEGALGSLIGGAKSPGLGHQFKKIKHQTAQGCGEHGSVTRFAQSWAAQPDVDRCVAQRPLGPWCDLSEKLQNVMAVTDFLALLWQEKQRPEHGSDLPGDGHGKEIDVCRLRLSAHACRARR